MDLKEEEILGDHIAQHWYYRSKAAALLAALDGIEASTALDIGSGSGFFARHLLDHTGIERIDCLDTSYEADTDETRPDGKVIRRRRALAAAMDQVDLAVLMDVLEHVDDDVGLLHDTAERVRPGGHLFVTVPAFGWLWSGHDVFLGHVRRYTLAEMESVFAKAGLTVDRGHYFFGGVFPAAAAQRLVDRIHPGEPGSKLKQHSAVANRLLTAISTAETRVQRFNRLGGLSVVVLGHRP
jgi:2-polyprenyl-3-methyl-5-hydroxy-6-metoxy-1,4-benzoquinol methylase